MWGSGRPATSSRGSVPAARPSWLALGAHTLRDLQVTQVPWTWQVPSHTTQKYKTSDLDRGNQERWESPKVILFFFIVSLGQFD